jgi:hypothetical protein
MKQMLALVLGLLVFAARSLAQDAAAIWKSLQAPVFDPEKTTALSDLTLVRDRLQLTFSDGLMQFSLPVNDVVYGAAFRGHGRVKVQPPSILEAQQLKLHTGQDSLDMEFTEAVLLFNDQTFDEVNRQAKWQRDADVGLAQSYVSRQQEREDAGAELLPRLLEGVLCEDRSGSAFFAADLKTVKKGWIHVRFDALDAEEIGVVQWKDWDAGITRPDVWLAFPAGNRSVVDAFKDPLAKARFRIHGYSIDATVTGGAELSAVTRVTVEHSVPANRVLVFQLDANLRVEKIVEGENTLEFVQPRDPKDRRQSYGDYVAVFLAQPGQQGQRQILEFHYRGKRVIRRVGKGQFFCQSFGWYPTIGQSFAARSDFDMNFSYPKRYKLVATGSLVKEGGDGNVNMSSWKSDVPLTVAGFAYGDYRVETNTSGSIKVEVYANKNADDSMASIQMSAEGDLSPDFPSVPSVALGSLSPSAMAKTMAQEVVNSVHIFEAFFGPYPYKRLAVTNIPYSYGQGWPGLLYLSALSFLDSTQRNALGITDMTGITDFFRAHETSHQWWGHLVSWKSYHDQWLSEGFAQFSGNLYVQFRQNMKEYLSRLRKDKEDLKDKDQRGRVYESLGPVWMGTRLASSSAPDGYAAVVYNKGGYVLHMLRMMLYDSRNPQNPDTRFVTMMKDFTRTYSNQAASTEDFKAIAEKHMTPPMDLDGNHRMDWFFNQYVYGTGIPEYRFVYQVQDAGEGKWKVNGKVQQSNVPATWKNLLPIYAHVSGKYVHLGFISVSGAETPFSAVLPLKPEKLSLNENEDVLAEIKQ